MCGIAGFIEAGLGRENASELIDRMCRVIRHRGPDDQGTWVGDGVALGMRRLSIIDLAGGHQPIFNEDKRILIVFNGEIYNYRDLKEDLRARGHTFRTDCDTEVIVHAYEEFGDDCVVHLRGMFTFAIWDRKRQRLLAARDRFGKKPLNYYWDGRRLIFGSEIKSILEADVPRQINPVALDEYLTFGYVPAPNTLFQGIMKLPAGNVLTWERGRLETKSYWEPNFAATCRDDESTALERTAALLKDAVGVRLMSDVPLGAFLSGGVDSSIVVGLMSELMTQPVKTFSIGFAEDAFNELPHARRIAQHFGTDHHEFLVEPKLVSILPELVWAYDEPFADASMLPTYYVSKLAREHVTVVLTGDGGDEIFGGYPRYSREAAFDRIPRPVRAFGPRLASLMREGMRGKKRLSSLDQDFASRFVQYSSIIPAERREVVYQAEFFAEVKDQVPLDRQRQLFRGATHLDPSASMQQVDAKMYLTDDILVKVDKASMINSLETRAPLLDQHLVSYVASLPSTLRMRNNTLKYLLKRIAANMLPADTLTRPKQGFSVPVNEWFGDELAEYSRDLLLSSHTVQRGIIRPEFIGHLLEKRVSTSWPWAGRAVWALLCLELWFQAYLDQPTQLRPHEVGSPIAANM